MRGLAVSRLVRAGNIRRNTVPIRGGHAHVPPPPVFARQPIPNRPLPEEYELIWNDTVAPELLIDFELAHWSSSKAVKAFFGGFLFFASVMGFSWITDPASQKPSIDRVVAYDQLAEAYTSAKQEKTDDE